MDGYLEVLGLLRMPLLIIVTSYIIAAAVYNCWYYYIIYFGIDRNCKAPLPPGGMGWPVIGESFKLLTQVMNFFFF